MIPIIGVVISAYVFTRMLENLAGKNSQITKAFALMLTSVFGAIALFTIGKS